MRVDFDVVTGPSMPGRGTAPSLRVNRVEPRIDQPDKVPQSTARLKAYRWRRAARSMPPVGRHRQLAEGEMRERTRVIVLTVCMSFVLSVSTGGVRAAATCAAGAQSRTAEKVLSDHRAAIVSHQFGRDVQCNYAENAIVISDAGVDRGREAIRRSLQEIAKVFGDTVPVVNSEVIEPLQDGSWVARVLFSVKTPCMDLSDGVDTYFIKGGQILWQSAHGLPAFRCASATQAR